MKGWGYMQLKWLLFSLNIILFIYCTYQNLRVSLGKYGKYTIKEEFFDSSSVYAYPLSLGYIFSCIIAIFLLVYQLKHYPRSIFENNIFIKYCLLFLFPLSIYFIQGMYKDDKVFQMKYELEILATLYWVIELISFYWILFC